MNDNILYVRMFGTLSFSYADKEISCSSNRSKLIWNILAYLLCRRGEIVSVEELSDNIWKQDKNGGSGGAMRTAIHRARSMLNGLTDDLSCQFLISKNGGYMWNPDIEMEVDADSFDELLKNIDNTEDTDLYLSAVKLYRGKFLSMQASELWVMPMHTYYHNVYVTLIDRIVPILEEEGRYEEGIEICRTALDIDPYTERIYQHLMRLLLVQGERQEIIDLYEDMSKLLLTTFGIMPDQESRALYREAIRSVKNGRAVSPEEITDQLREQGSIGSALVCDFDFFKMVYQAQARAIVRSGIVIHTAILTLKSRGNRAVSAKSMALAMDNFERHMSEALRKGDVITRCSSSQFIVMLPTANYENSCKVCQRFISAFEKRYPHSPVCIDYFVQPIEPSSWS